MEGAGTALTRCSVWVRVHTAAAIEHTSAIVAKGNTNCRRWNAANDGGEGPSTPYGSDTPGTTPERRTIESTPRSTEVRP